MGHVQQGADLDLSSYGGYGNRGAGDTLAEQGRQIILCLVPKSDVADGLLVQYGLGVVIFGDRCRCLGFLADNADHGEVAGNMAGRYPLGTIGGDNVNVECEVRSHGKAVLGHDQAFPIQGQHRAQPDEIGRGVVQSAEGVDGVLIFDRFRFAP